MAEPSLAQQVAEPSPEAGNAGIGEILVTAQRQAQALQDVPIALSAFSAAALERQQIDNMSDLQLTLPNASYSKTNFNSSNLTIRGIGRSVISSSADSGVGIHLNDMPVVAPLLFETEFFDLERIEVLRGPQGTLFGRNATGGVMNIITKRPTDMFEANGAVEYGNYDSVRMNGMVNMPLGRIGALRLAGQYVYRDGYSQNLFDGSRIDGRNNYALRSTLRLAPSERTTLDLIGSYFHEKSDRSRIQKQLCNRDPTGILGCAPARLAFEPVNGNAMLSSILASREFLSIVASPALAPFGLVSIYGTDAYAGVTVPTDLRAVSIDFNPQFKAHEAVVMARLEQKIGDNLAITFAGGYQESDYLGRTDYNLTAANPITGNTGAAAFRAAFPTAAARLFQGSNIGVSAPGRGFTGYIGGDILRYADRTTEYDQSNETARQYSIEAHIDSKFDGMFNFLVGALYLDYRSELDYYVMASPLDYGSLVLGTAASIAAGAPQTLGFTAPFYDNENHYRLQSKGLFGEAYLALNGRLKLTLGLRHSHDEKLVNSRQAPLATGGPRPFGTTRIDVPYVRDRVTFNRLTGRVVLDWKPEVRFTDDTLVYLSYSRGYKAGGINPAAPSGVPGSFAPEAVNAFEIGTKNRSADGAFQANLTAFYYDYKGYQLTRMIDRSPVNDNADATVHGVEGEFLLAPTPALLFNINASYLKTRIKRLESLDPRDPSGGRSDVVIIKDLLGASNCAVIPNMAGDAAGANRLVAAFNSAVGLRAPVPVPGTSTTGAFSLCNALADTIVSPPAPLRALFATPTGPLPFTVSGGVAQDLSGNELPNAPDFKFSVGGQYSWNFADESSLVARVDYAFTDSYWGRQFNKPIDRIPSYDVINASVQFNAPNNGWFVRAFVQNIEDDDAITGLAVGDQAAGLFTNIFTLEPRRYGIAAGFHF